MMTKVNDKNLQTITYEVTGMTCGGCVNRVKKTLADYADLVEVTLQPPQAIITQPKANFSELNAALSKVGHYALLRAHSLEAASSDDGKHLPDAPTQSWLAIYRPLLLVFGYILLVSLIVEVVHGSFALHRLMPHFMAGFFLVFSFFKMLDIAGFASSYAMYDVLAKRFKPYGYIYPFIELALGVAYALNWQPVLVNWVTLLVMGFSSIGVILAVMNKQKIRCACLGTGFNLPMTTVTIIEDLLMVAMAAWMLFF